MSNNELLLLVRRQIILTNSRFLTFLNVSAQLQIESDLLDEEAIKSAFDHLKNGERTPSMKEKLSKNVMDLILTIHAEFERAEKGLERRICGPNGSTIYRDKSFLCCKLKCAILQIVVGCKMMIINERYGLDVRLGKNDEDPLLFLVDLFYGEQRKLNFTFTLPERVYDYTYFLHILDNDRFFLICTHELGCGYTDSYFYLYRLDYANFSCQFLDQECAYGNYTLFVPDQKDENAFLVYTEDESNYFYRGRLDGEKVKIGRGIYTEYLGSCLRMENGELFHLAYDGQEKSLYYCKKSLEREDEEYEEDDEFERGNRLFKFDFDSNADPETFEAFFKEKIGYYYWYSRYFWDGNIGYVLQQIKGEKSQKNQRETRMIKVDLDERKVSYIPLPKMPQIIDMKLSEEGTLMMFVCCIKLDDKRLHFVHRIPLGQPDTLLNASIFNVAQNSAFLDANEYEKLCKRLPQKFRPFSAII